MDIAALCYTSHRLQLILDESTLSASRYCMMTLRKSENDCEESEYCLRAESARDFYSNCFEQTAMPDIWFCKQGVF